MGAAHGPVADCQGALRVGCAIYIAHAAPERRAAAGARRLLVFMTSPVPAADTRGAAT